MKYISIILFNLILNQIHFTDIPNDTGIFHPIIIEECIGLDIGDEIGLFDTQGLTSSDCSDQYDDIFYLGHECSPLVIFNVVLFKAFYPYMDLAVTAFQPEISLENYIGRRLRLWDCFYHGVAGYILVTRSHPTHWG